MVSQIGPQEGTKTKERLRGHTVYYCSQELETGAWYSIQGHRERHQVVRKQKTRARGRFRPHPYWLFCRKGQAARGVQFRTN